jgi:hypothetical protein
MRTIKPLRAIKVDKVVKVVKDFKVAKGLVPKNVKIFCHVTGLC